MSRMRNSLKTVLFATSITFLLVTIVSCEKPVFQVEKPLTGDDLDITVAELSRALPGEVVIRTGKAQITKQELRDAFMDLFAKPTTEDTYEKVAKSVLSMAMSRNYIYMEAVERKLDVDPDIWFKWEILSNFWLGDFFMERKFREIKVEKEVLDAFSPPDAHAFKLLQITVQSLAAAQDLKNRVADGQDFAELARKYSIDPAAPNGGVLKNIQVMGMGNLYGDEILKRMVAVEEGELSAILATPMGYTVFRVVEKRPLNEKELTTIRRRKEAELRSGLMESYLVQVREKFPLKIMDENLEQALNNGTKDIIVAGVGEFDITMNFLSGYTTYLMASVDRPRDRNPDAWKRVLFKMQTGLALSQEAVTQGMKDDEAVKENMERVRKYSLASTLLARLSEDREPTDKELYRFYLESAGQSGAGGAYSIEGITGLDQDKAGKISDLLSSGRSIQNIINDISLPGRAEQIAGTFSESDFDEETLIAIEKTPAGEVTPPISQDGSVSVYRVLAKSRGELPPFNEAYESLKERYRQERVQNARDGVIIAMNKKYPPEYLVPREAVDKLIGQWLDMQKALRGVSPPGGFHRTGSDYQLKSPGGGKPSGHP
ncbi:MAG: peptidyl-prolyl cis-trans isomerase [bacterium]